MKKRKITAPHASLVIRQHIICIFVQQFPESYCQNVTAKMSSLFALADYFRQSCMSGLDQTSTSSRLICFPTQVLEEERFMNKFFFCAAQSAIETALMQWCMYK